MKNNGDDGGDVDIAFQFESAVNIDDVLPISASFMPNVRNMSYSSQFYLAEIKRSCDSTHMDRKVEQFVNFYYELFSSKQERYKKLNLRGINSVVKDAITHNAVLLFVFNGADNVNVWNVIKRKIKKKSNKTEDDTIHGRRVVCVYCSSAELIKWRDLQEKDEIIEEKEQIIEKNEQEIKVLKAEIEKLNKRKLEQTEVGQPKKRRKPNP